MPFEAPEGWVWMLLSDLGKIVGGGTPSTKQIDYWDNGSIAWITPADLSGYESKYISQGNRNITEKGLAESSTVLMPAGSVLFSSRAPIGYCAISLNAVCTNQGFKSIVPYIGETNEYLYYYLKATVEVIQSRASGTTFKEIAGSEFGNTVVVLPPLAEQYRIIAAIESAFSIIDEIERSKKDLQTTIIAAKSKILSLAICGKLVSQNPAEEPASVLLERIRTEREGLIKTSKIRRNKVYSAIIRGGDNSYYGNLPNGWIASRLDNLVSVISGTSYKKADPVETGIRILRGGNIQDSRINLYEDDVFIPQHFFDAEKQVQQGDIIIVSSTGSKTLIGKAGFSYADLKNIQIGAFLRVIRPESKNLAGYLRVIFASDFYRNHIRDFAKGTNINNIKVEHITDFVIPLPPLAEQQRIVTALEAAFNQLDSITATLM
jgi:type I restriction enzyme S subunit